LGFDNDFSFKTILALFLSMSSHHIVREKQEPALLVLSLDTFDDELFGQLLEWSPTLMATAQVAEKLNAFGIKIDWLLSNEASDIQSDVKTLAPAGQPIVQAALSYLVNNGYPSVNVVCDEVALEDYIPFANQINLVIFCGNEKIYPVQPGFSKWKPAGELIRFLNPPSVIQFTGLEPLSENEFQTVSDGFFTVDFNQGLLFIAEQL
jgi:thiamine pyrophosphokinase